MKKKKGNRERADELRRGYDLSKLKGGVRGEYVGVYGNGTRILPRLIRSEKENAACARALYELDRRGGKQTRTEKELADLLTLLIEDFEAKHYELPRAKPVDVLRFLMDQHSLKQKDLIGVFRARSIVSEVLSGKRKLNREHIERLSQRFRVSPDVFF